jgi:regulator of nucleoside diphosphate kinase
MSRIILSRVDFARIKKSIYEARQNKTVSAAELDRLTNEIDGARIVEPNEIPSDVVTMNSIVSISFPKAKKNVEFQIVYPGEASLKDNKISILSPVATALIGYKEGDEIEWIVPAGLTTIKISKIIYQPEAAGEFDL